MKEVNLPQISVIVITYNSGRFILETLDSVKNQLYSNIELIISDDFSSDNTIEVVKTWVSSNCSFFTTVNILESDKNNGVSANCNRGIRNSSGEWLKIIAGDDMLLPECLAANMEFCKDKGARICFSNVIEFGKNITGKAFNNVRFFNGEPMARTNITSHEQFELLKRGNRISAVSVFFSRKLYDEVGGFDERIKMLEDWPMWLKITSSGNKIWFLDKATAMYRIHESSISNSSNGALFNKIYASERLVYEHYIQKSDNSLSRIFERYLFMIKTIMNRLNVNSNTLLPRLLFSFLLLPYRCYWKLSTTIKSK